MQVPSVIQPASVAFWRNTVDIAAEARCLQNACSHRPIPVTWSFLGTDDEARSTQASADFMRSHYRNMAAVVIGRGLFDLTNGWDDKPAAGEARRRRHPSATDGLEARRCAPFTFADGVEKAISTAKELAGDRDVDMAAGEIGSQALKLGLIDQVVVNQVPVVFGSGRPVLRHRRPGRATAVGEPERGRPPRRRRPRPRRADDA
jgi:dihydrofolate reductase